MAGIGSILVADCGSTMTTVALIDRVNGHHRLLARGEAISTHHAPWTDVTVGVKQAIRQIETLVGRALLTQRGELIRSRRPDEDGVDAFAAVSSAAAPMRVMLAGLTRNLSVASARRALADPYVEIAGVLALDEGGAGRDLNARMRILRQAQPEVIVITGGTDGGASRPVMEIAQLVALYSRMLPPEDRPAIFYAGNAHLAPEVVPLFAASATLHVVANVRPGLDVENLDSIRTQLHALYRDRWLTSVPGMHRLREWAGRPVSPAARSFGQVIRYVGERYQLNVLGFDLGSSSTILAAQVGDCASLTTGANLGIGLSVPAALSQIPMERITRWLPFEMQPDRARDTLLNKGLQPHSVPQTREDLLLEYALAREVMRQPVAGAQDGWTQGSRTGKPANSQWDLIIGAGRTLTRTPRPGYAVLLLLDALEPAGVSKIALDTGSVAGLLGAAATVHPLAAVEVIEYDAFLTAGTVIALSGTARQGDTALRLDIRYQGGRTIQEEVSLGSLRVIPLQPGQHASLELHPAPGFDVGVGQPGQSATAEAEGGTIGIIIDARGRPLPIPNDAEERRQRMQAWLDGIGVGGG